MKATQKLHEMGQSLWLDNITRGLLTSGTLRRYIQEFSITGLTSNPTIFDHALKISHDYDDGIRQKVQKGPRNTSCCAARGRAHVFPRDDVGVRNNLQNWLRLAKPLDYEGSGEACPAGRATQDSFTFICYLIDWHGPAIWASGREYLWPGWRRSAAIPGSAGSR